MAQGCSPPPWGGKHIPVAGAFGALGLMAPVNSPDSAPWLSAIRAIIFDGDGVLFDTEPLCFDAFCQTVGELYGRPYDIAQVTEFAGVIDRDIVATLNGRFRAEVDHHLFHHRKHELYDERAARGGLKPVGGAGETLTLCARLGVPVGLASSAPPGKIERNRQMTGLAFPFHVVVSGENVPRSKPAPDIFLETARQLGVAPEGCVVVEDAISGLTGARAAGCRAIALAGTFPAAELQGHADAVVASHAELREWLGRIAPRVANAEGRS